MMESEVREIVKKFNDSLNKYTQEYSDMEKRVAYLIDKIELK